MTFSITKSSSLNLPDSNKKLGLMKKITVSGILISLDSIRKILFDDALLIRTISLPNKLKHFYDIHTKPVTSLNSLLENIKLILPNFIIIKPYSFKIALIIFFQLYNLSKKENNFKIQLVEISSDFGTKSYSLKFTIDDINIFEKDVLTSELKMVSSIINILTEPRHNLIKPALSLQVIENICKCAKYLSYEDNSPSLLEYFDTDKTLNTYGLQSLNHEKEISACIRDNYNAFDNNLSLSDSRDYFDWTSPIQQQQISKMEQRVKEKKADEEALKQAKDLFNPERLLSKIPARSFSYRDDYLSKVTQFYKRIEIFFDTIINISRPPIILRAPSSCFEELKIRLI